MEAIKSGHVTMRPRWHFILKASLFAVGVMVVLLLLLYVASFAIFASHQTGIWFVTIFGSRGWYEFFISFPWILVALILVFIVILEVLVRHYSFGYGQPLLFSAVGIMVIVIIGGVVLARTPFHGRLFRYAEEDKLPLAGRFYRSFGLQRMRNVHVGAIIEVTDGGFAMENRRRENLQVVVSPQTTFPLGTDFAEGDTVVVFGERNDSLIKALGIRKVDNEFGPPMMKSDMMHRPFRAPIFR